MDINQEEEIPPTKSGIGSSPEVIVPKKRIKNGNRNPGKTTRLLQQMKRGPDPKNRDPEIKIRTTDSKEILKEAIATLEKSTEEIEGKEASRKGTLRKSMRPREENTKKKST